jgi:hypothetical protein
MSFFLFANDVPRFANLRSDDLCLDLVESKISISVIFHWMTLPHVLSHSTQQAHLEFIVGTLHYFFFFVIYTFFVSTKYEFLSFRERRTVFG